MPDFSEPANLSRHLECHFYAGHNCPFETKLYKKGETLRKETGEFYLFVFVDGPSVLTIDKSGNSGISTTETHREPYFFFLGSDTSFEVTVGVDNVRISTFEFDKPSQLCGSYSINQLKPFAPCEHKFVTLPINDTLSRTVESVVKLYEDLLRCSNILSMKLQEIFFVISAYYGSEELGQLLAPLLRKEIDFKEFVNQNFLRCDTVQALADLRGQNLRQFKKEFSEAYNVPPYAWMLQQKAKFIDERLADPTVPFSEIVEDFRFSSPSHFTVFCRRQFNMTPTQRRRMLIRDEAEKRAAERRARHPHILDK